MSKIIKPLYDFSAEKNRQLMSERGICFEDVIVALDEELLLYPSYLKMRILAAQVEPLLGFIQSKNLEITSYSFHFSQS
jgi:hypothetical protein